MNLISQAFSGLITWTQAEAKIIAAEAAIAGEGILGVVVTDVKQIVSDAIGQADSFLAANYASIAKATETGLEAELAVLTRGLSTPLNPIMSKGIDDMAAAAVAAAHAWALAAKAALAAANVNVGPAQLQINNAGNVGVVANAPGLQAQLDKDSRD